MSAKPHQPAQSPALMIEALEDRLLMSAAHHKHHNHAHHNNHSAHHKHSHHHHHIRHHDHILHHDHLLHTSRRGSHGIGNSSSGSGSNSGGNANNGQNQTGPITLFTIPATRTISDALKKKIDGGLPLFP